MEKAAAVQRHGQLSMGALLPRYTLLEHQDHSIVQSCGGAPVGPSARPAANRSALATVRRGDGGPVRAPANLGVDVKVILMPARHPVYFV